MRVCPSPCGRCPQSRWRGGIHSVRPSLRFRVARLALPTCGFLRRCNHPASPLALIGLVLRPNRQPFDRCLRPKAPLAPAGCRGNAGVGRAVQQVEHLCPRRPARCTTCAHAGSRPGQLIPAVAVPGFDRSTAAQRSKQPSGSPGADKFIGRKARKATGRGSDPIRYL